MILLGPNGPPVGVPGMRSENLRAPNRGISAVYSWPSFIVLPSLICAMARMTTSGREYQLVEPAWSPSPHIGCGHHLAPSGVSIVSPLTHGLPMQPSRLSAVHSATAAPLATATAAPSAPAAAKDLR